MPKLKTKSSAKRRFKISGSGLVRRTQTGKRHGMIKLTGKAVRSKRGMVVSSKEDRVRVLSFLPYGR